MDEDLARDLFVIVVAMIVLSPVAYLVIYWWLGRPRK